MPQHRIELARFAHLPLGALAADWVIDTADALFARCLRDAGHVLWAEDATLPDLAGKGGADAAPPTAEDMLALDGQKRAEVPPCPLSSPSFNEHTAAYFDDQCALYVIKALQERQCCCRAV